MIFKCNYYQKRKLLKIKLPLKVLILVESERIETSPITTRPSCRHSVILETNRPGDEASRWAADTDGTCVVGSCDGGNNKPCLERKPL